MTTRTLFFVFNFSLITYISSFSLAQRKEAKETSTYPHPLPIWRGSTENCGYRQFSDFSAVKSGIKARFCFLFGLRQVVGAKARCQPRNPINTCPSSPSSPLSPSSHPHHHFISILRNAVSSPAIFSCCQMLGCQLAP